MRHSLRLIVSGALLFSAAQAFAAPQALRPEVGKPLQQAQTQLQEKKYRDALNSVGEASKVSGLTAYERYIIDRVRAAAAAGAGDYGTALQAYQSALASSEFPAAEKLPTLEAVARLAYSGKKYAEAATAIKNYQAAGGNNADTMKLLPQALYLAENFPEAGRVQREQIAALEKAGKAPTEAELQLLASIALKQNDSAGYVAALEKLATYHSQPSYWLDLVVRTSRKTGFSDRLTLDVYRLRASTGTLDKAGDYLEATQLALQAGLPGEAEQFLKAGYERKLLGAGSAGEIDRHKRLSDLVAKKIAEDKQSMAEGEKAALTQASGDALVATGLNYVGYGDYERGIALIQQGIAKGQLKQAEAAKLHLGYAYLRAGKKADAVKVLKTVGGTTGEADLARLWTIRAASL
jgi:hypothetical protein